MTECEHNIVTSTFEKGPHCYDCKEPLVSVLWTISRNTPAGAILYAMRQQPVAQEPKP